MIDFACKEFKVEDVIKCALNLTKADLKVMKYFLNETEQWIDSESLSKILHLDISTIQRSVKKLHEKEILQRSQQNLDGGGYVFRYKIHSKTKIKNIIMTVVNSWADRLGQELEKMGKWRLSSLLKITPYLGILVLIVSIGGLWYPALGYFMLLIFAAIFLSSPFRGRWFCGNLCPRGSLVDFWVSKISKKKRIPGTLRSLWVRLPIFFLLMGFMGYRISSIIGSLNTFEKIGMVFVTMCLVTTAIAILLGGFLSPRTWCSFCPMGTAQRLLGGKRYQLKLAKEKCINCKKCEKVCPMQLKIRESETKPDCIKCGRCVTVCPKDALKF